MFPEAPLRCFPLLALVLVAGCGGKPATDKPQRPDNRFAVATALVATQDLVPELTVPARFEAAETARCTARVAGPVVRVLVGEGKAVKAGEPLAELDATRLRLTVASAEATVLKAQAAADEAGKLVLRRQQLAKDNLTTAEDLEAALSRATQAAAELGSAKAARDRAAADLTDAVITAPVTGIIERKTVDTGQWVMVGQELFTIVRRDPLQVRAQVPPEMAATLTANLPVTVRAEGQEAVGAIVLVAQAADPATGRVPILARLSQPPAAHRPGGFADLTLRGTPRTAMVVPASAIRPTERGLVAYLAIEGVARERPVETGTRTPEGGLEILRGLVPGDLLITTGADALKDGSLLRTEAGADAKPAKRPQP